jgi:hypothetical protein
MLDAIAGVLIRCFVIALACLILLFLVVLCASEWAYQIHSKIIPISREQFAVVNYAVLLAIRGIVFLFFLLPYVGIKLVLKKRRARPSNQAQEDVGP